jgi:phage recombination protein Bet
VSGDEARVAAAGLAVAPEFTSREIATLKDTVGKGLSDPELGLFLAYAKRTGLDPFTRQIMAWKQGDRMVLHVGIDGLRAVAERSGEYAGQGPVKFEFEKQADGTQLLISATATVYRKGWEHPVEVTAFWCEYAPKAPSPESSWGRLPTVMLGKVAEAAALRKAFPRDLSQLYEPAEMTE